MFLNNRLFHMFLNESVISDNDVASKSGSAILDSTHEHHHHHHGEHVKVLFFIFYLIVLGLSKK